MSEGAIIRRRDLPLADQILGPLRLLVGAVLFFFYTWLFGIILVLLLPWRVGRIKACNYYGKLSGGTAMWLSGCPITINGREELDPDRPAIYVSNHTSIVDLFLGMWISPVGTVGIAKKQVIFYPLLGQLYLLSGHLRIDRDNPKRAIESMKELAGYVREKRLSVWIWPEGTRSRDGRLLPFKKGAIHLAMQSGLPIVPVVVTGAQKAWVKNSLIVMRVPITITALPAIDTTGWTEADVDKHTEELYQAFAKALPADQQPDAAKAA